MKFFFTRVCAKALARHAARSVMALGLIVGSMQAMAGTITFPTRAPMSVLTFPATVSPSRDVAVGTVLSSQTANPGLAAGGVTCNVQKSVTVDGTLVPGSTNVYQTGIPGIGVRFYITDSWNGGWDAVPDSQTIASPSGSTAHYTRADLVVTGQVGNGAIAAWPSMTVTFSGGCITTVTQTQSIGGTTAITGTTCSVMTPALNFVLPKAFSKNLATAGSTTGDTVVPLSLNCPAGVNVAMTITDAVTPANRSTSLSLTADSSASGVGVQILNGSTPVAFGPDSAVAGNANQFSLGTSTAGVMQVPLTARYVRTAGTLVPGSIKANATFTMSYQ